MTELLYGIEQDYREQWIAAGRPLPLEVSRSRYENPMPRTWEVLWHETPTGDVPIAEFTTWEEAQAWAVAQALAITGSVR